MTLERQAWRIRQRLEILGWPQSRLAAQIGMRPGDLNKYLKTDTAHTKKHGIDAGLAYRMARVLGLTPHYILFGDRDQLSAEVINTLPPEPD
jgi:transcriptional regulator with XRE-family HTH domain